MTELANFSLAYAKNPNQIVYKTFDPLMKEGEKGQIFEWEDLKSKPIQAIFIPHHILEDKEVQYSLELLKKEIRHTPLRPTSENKINADSFEQMSYQQAYQEFEKTFLNWTLQNNLNLLSELFTYLKHLKSIFPNDRTSFFEELWHLFKNNLGAKDIKIIYNHLPKRKKERGKDSLTRVIVEGDKYPNPIENQELGEALMKNYEGLFTHTWKVHEYNPKTGKLVALASINQSPVLIMATVYNLSALQKALFKSLFDGLQT